MHDNAKSNHLKTKHEKFPSESKSNLKYFETEFNVNKIFACIIYKLCTEYVRTSLIFIITCRNEWKENNYY